MLVFREEKYMGIKIFVDSGSSIKLEEKEKYNVEIIPLKNIAWW